MRDRPGIIATDKIPPNNSKPSMKRQPATIRQANGMLGSLKQILGLTLCGTALLFGIGSLATLRAQTTGPNSNPLEGPSVTSLLAPITNRHCIKCATTIYKLDKELSVPVAAALGQLKKLQSFLEEQHETLPKNQAPPLATAAEAAELRKEHQNSLAALKELRSFAGSIQEAKTLMDRYGYLRKSSAKRDSSRYSQIAESERVALETSIRLVQEKAAAKERVISQFVVSLEKLHNLRLSRDPDYVAHYEAAQQRRIAEQHRAITSAAANSRQANQSAAVLGLPNTDPAYEQRKRQQQFEAQFLKINPQTQWIDLKR